MTGRVFLIGTAGLKSIWVFGVAIMRSDDSDHCDIGGDVILLGQDKIFIQRMCI
ncbi:MAG: hypothetical protein CM1200mP41_16710 [Gammaproteobacteria bacterium]|nr:MAG: hypothetical protein CM1200mP41_16710 [Gammaproteobacteria bacterium]